MVVYKILPQLCDYEDILIVGEPLPKREYKDEDEDSAKQEIERVFEIIRKNNYQDCYPRQQDCFFVFGDQEEECTWLMEMYSKNILEYILVVLEVEENVQWYNVYHFNDASGIDGNNIESYAHKYWLSKADKYTKVDGSLYEGLYNGTNSVKAWYRKRWNGLQNRIECLY